MYFFVIGRNIYQAACGGSNAASAFIQRFMEKTEGLEDTKRKCLMDGILFEVFFDRKGQHRVRPKMGFFSEALKLQVHPELAASFSFLDEQPRTICRALLLASGQREADHHRYRSGARDRRRAPRSASLVAGRNERPSREA